MKSKHRAKTEVAPMELKEAFSFLQTAMENLLTGEAYEVQTAESRSQCYLWLHPNWKLRRSSLKTALKDVSKYIEGPAWRSLRVHVTIGVEHCHGAAIEPFVPMKKYKWLVDTDGVCYFMPRRAMYANVDMNHCDQFDLKADALKRNFGDLTLCVEVATP